MVHYRALLPLIYASKPTEHKVVFQLDVKFLIVFNRVALRPVASKNVPFFTRVGVKTGVGSGLSELASFT